MRRDPSGEQRELQISHHAPGVPRIDPLRRSRIDGRELAVQRGAALSGCPGLEGRADRRVGRRFVECETVQQRSDVEAGPADDIRGMPAVPDDREGRATISLITGGVVHGAGIDEIDAVMADAPLLLRRRLRGPDVHTAVHLARIGRHDLATGALRGAQRKGALPRRGRPHDRDDVHCGASIAAIALRAEARPAGSGSRSPYRSSSNSRTRPAAAANRGPWITARS